MICQHSRLFTKNNNSLMRIQIVILRQVDLLRSPDWSSILMPMLKLSLRLRGGIVATRAPTPTLIMIRISIIPLMLMRIQTRLTIIENNQLNMRKVIRILLQVPTLIIQIQTRTQTQK